MATVAVEERSNLQVRRERRHRRWYRTPTFVAGIVLLGLIVGMAAAAPLLTSYDPTAQDLLHTLLLPSPQHFLGTDEYGRDVWARLLYGARIDLQVGFFAEFTPFVTGTILGCLAGYYGRWLDSIVMSVVDVVMAFPFYVLIIALVFVLGTGTRGIYIAFALVGWVSYARIIRGEVLVVKKQEYVLAVRVASFNDVRILFRHILPNVIIQAIVYAMSDIVVIIVGIVTLSYLGLGVPPPTPDWGGMISDGQTFITTNWQLATIPGLAVVVVGLALSLVGDGLAELLKPQ